MEEMAFVLEFTRQGLAERIEGWLTCQNYWLLLQKYVPPPSAYAVA